MLTPGSSVEENARVSPTFLHATNSLLPTPPKSPNNMLISPPKSPITLLPTPPKSPINLPPSPPKSPPNNFLRSPPKSPPNYLRSSRQRPGSRRLRNVSKLPSDRDTELPQSAQDITDPYGGIFVNPALPSIARPRWHAIPNETDNTDNNTLNSEGAYATRGNGQSRENTQSTDNIKSREHRRSVKKQKSESVESEKHKGLSQQDSGYSSPHSANANPKDPKFRFDDNVVDNAVERPDKHLAQRQMNKSKDSFKAASRRETLDINQNRKSTGEMGEIKWYQRIGRSLARTVHGAENRYMTTSSCDDHIGVQNNGHTSFDPECKYFTY